MHNFIEDGYTEAGYIAEEPGIHNDLTFSFRPIMVAKRDALNALYLTDRHEEAISKVSEEMSRSIQSWSLVDTKGQPVVRSAANMRRIKPRLFDKLWQVLCGMKASDPRPEDPEKQPTELEADAKN